jgi:outer membrane protein insertion porin family
MINIRLFYFSFLVAIGGTLAWDASAISISRIELKTDQSVNRARIEDLLEIRSGNEFSKSELVKGLSRIAASGLYKKVEATFDESDGSLLVIVDPLDRVAEIEILVSKEELKDRKYRQFLENDLRDSLPIRVGATIQLDSVPLLRNKLTTRLKDRGFPNAAIVAALEDGDASAEKKVLISVTPGPREFLDGFELAKFHSKDIQILKEELSDTQGFENVFPEFRTPDKLADYPEEYLIKNLRFKQKVDTAPEIRSKGKFPLDWVALNQALSDWSARSRSAGFYEFRHSVEVVNRDSGRFLRIELNSGPRYRVQMHGNVFFWERDLRNQILDKTLRLGVPLNLQEAQNQLLSRYRAAGFADGTVEYEAIQSHGVLTVNFRIHEGRRYFLSEVLWDGLSSDEIELVRPLVDRWRSEISPVTRIYYSEEAVPLWIDQLSSILRENGFLSLRVLGHRAIRRKDSPAIDLELSAQIGARYRIRDVIVTGRPLLPSKDLRKAILLKKGDWADFEKILRSGERIRSFHAEKGFVNCDVSKKAEDIIRFSEISDEVDLNYAVDPGPEVRVGKIIVEGLSRTKEPVVLREFESRDFNQGSVWNPTAAQDTEGSLLGLGIFSSVKRDAVGGRLLNRAEESGSPVDILERDLKVAVIERPAGALEFGPGYRTDLGLAVFAEMNYRNLWGMNRSIFLRSQISWQIQKSRYLFPEQKYSISFLEPFVLNYPVRFRINSKYEKEDERVFDATGQIRGYAQKEFSIKFLLEKDFGNFRISQGLYALDFPEIFNVVDPAGVARKYRIASMDTFLSSDTRDNLFNPTKGYYWFGNLEYAAPSFGSDDDVHYYSLSTQASGYYTPIRHVTFAGWLSYAHIETVGSSISVPVSKRLAVGGRGSVRSLPEKFLQYNEQIVASEDTLEAKFEYRQAFLADIAVAFFLDAGQIWAQGQGTSGFRRGMGVGLRYQTPVGPLALDLAINLDRKDGEEGSRILFSVGNL